MARRSWLALVVLFLLFACASSNPHKFSDKQDAHDDAHIKEHMANKIETNVPFTVDKQRFLYFLMYDENKDGFVDGTEVLKQVAHVHVNGEHQSGAPVKDEEKMIQTVDYLLRKNDLDGDGRVAFAEFCFIQEQQEKEIHEAMNESGVEL